MALTVSRKARSYAGRRARSTQSKSFAYSHSEEYRGHDLEIACTAEVEIEPGERAIMYGDNACPGSDPEVSIVRVTIDATGEDITDEVDEETIRELALEDYDAEEGSEEDPDDARDRARDRAAERDY